MNMHGLNSTVLPSDAFDMASRSLNESRGRTTGEDVADREELFASGPGFAASLAANLDDSAEEMDEAALREQQSREQLREAAEQLVASAFVLPFLQQVRSESLGSDLFHGGFAEDAFGQQLDTHLADKFVQSGNFPLVDAVERYMTKQGGPTAASLGREVNLHG